MAVVSTRRYALIELLGKQRLVGLTSSEAGGVLIVSPMREDGTLGDPQLFGPGAIFRLVFCDEKTAKATAASAPWGIIDEMPSWAKREPVMPELEECQLIAYLPADGPPVEFAAIDNISKDGRHAYLTIFERGNNRVPHVEPVEKLRQRILRLRTAGGNIIWERPGHKIEKDPFDTEIPF